jgi:hypothetical protein
LFPPANTSISDKARAFAYTINAVHGHLDDYDSKELSLLLTGCVPGNCGAAASKAIAYGAALPCSIFELHNVEGLFFCFLKGTKAKESDLNTDPALPSPDITSVTIRSIVNPNKITPASVKISQPSFEVEITLPIPQTPIPAANRLPTNSPISKFKTTRQSAKPATKKTVTTDTGQANGFKVTEDNGGSVLNKLSQKQIQDLSDRSFQLSTPTMIIDSSIDTPRMLDILKSSGDETFTTYTGPLNFLDNQISFDNIFWHPTPTSKNRSVTTSPKIIGRCQYFVLTYLLRQDHVSSDSTTKAKASSNLTAEIRNLSYFCHKQRKSKQPFLGVHELCPLAPKQGHIPVIKSCSPVSRCPSQRLLQDHRSEQRLHHARGLTPLPQVRPTRCPMYCPQSSRHR